MATHNDRDRAIQTLSVEAKDVCPIIDPNTDLFWIFQEYLLSPMYILSGEDGVEVALVDIHDPAGMLYSRFPDQDWLNELFNWLSRLMVLKRRLSYREDYDSNMLLLAGSLSATVSCHKYYALLGALKLKKLDYVDSHTEQEALQAVVMAFTQAGRLSWLYAVPPTIEIGMIALEIRDGLHLEHRGPQFPTILSRPTTSPSTITFTCVYIGHVVETSDLSEALSVLNRYTRAYTKQQVSMPHHSARLPLSSLPFCQHLITTTANANGPSEVLCRGAEAREGDSLPNILMKMLTLQDFRAIKVRRDPLGELPDDDVFVSSAYLVQQRIDSTKAMLDIVVRCSMYKLAEKLILHCFALSRKGCTSGTVICSFDNMELFFAVEMGGDIILHRFISALYQSSHGAGGAPILALRSLNRAQSEYEVTFRLSSV